MYQSAVDALGYRSIVGVGQTIYINDVEPVSRGKLKFDNADENDFVTAVKFGPEGKIRETIHSLMAPWMMPGCMPDSSSCIYFPCLTA